MAVWACRAKAFAVGEDSRRNPPHWRVAWWAAGEKAGAFPPAATKATPARLRRNRVRWVAGFLSGLSPRPLFVSRCFQGSFGKAPSSSHRVHPKERAFGS